MRGIGPPQSGANAALKCSKQPCDRLERKGKIMAKQKNVPGDPGTDRYFKQFAGRPGGYAAKAREGPWNTALAAPAICYFCFVGA